MASPIMEALKQFAAAEANLAKAEKLWEELQELFPGGISVGETPEYEDRSRSFSILIGALPRIDGWLPEVSPPDWDAIVSTRFDFLDLGDPMAEAQFEASVWESGRGLREYRFRLNQKRRELIRDALVAVIDKFDIDLRAVRQEVGDPEPSKAMPKHLWKPLRDHADEIEVLLGGSVQRPSGWGNLRRHLGFGQASDLYDIENHDWPNVRAELRKGLYGVNEPVPVEAVDLADLVASKPRGPITIALDWKKLDDDGFERLIFALISHEVGYENPEWLMKTRAPDRGRDLSVTRVTTDPLSGTRRQRIVIQCKHWLSKSLSLPDVVGAREQTRLWENPRVDVLIIATTGRFTADAVQWVEKQNMDGSLPLIEMWPDSHLERLLAARPALIAEFRLR